MSPTDRVAQLYPQATVSIFIAFYYSQGYGGGILTRLHTGGIYVLIANNQNEFTLKITPVCLRHAQNAETRILMFSTTAI
jgi:hypothetical protein